MKLSEELYRIGREAPLTPEDRNTILNAAAEMTSMRDRLSTAEDELSGTGQGQDVDSGMFKTFLEDLAQIYGE